MKIKYVYNTNCADFLIKHGAIPLGVGINYNSKKVYVSFGYNQCQEAYEKWNNYKIIQEEVMKKVIENYKYIKDEE